MIGDKPILCDVCDSATPEATVIHVSVPGNGNSIQLFMCPECMRGAEGGKQPGSSLLALYKDLIVAGLKKLVGV